jgi:RNA polymerase-binding transcription factor DksA
MDDVDCAAERIEAFNQMALSMVLHQQGRHRSTGICKSCGCIIEPQRLSVNPYASHCWECADELEQERRRVQRSGPLKISS